MSIIDGPIKPLADPRFFVLLGMGSLYLKIRGLKSHYKLRIQLYLANLKVKRLSQKRERLG